MSLNSTSFKIQYSGNGATTVFSFPYLFLDNSHLVVTETVTATGVDTLKTITTHYTVTGAGVAAGGSVTMLTAPATGVRLTIERTVPITQLTDYQTNDNFPAETHESALDKLTMVSQQISSTGGSVDRALKFPSTEAAGFVSTLGSAVARASSFLGFDANGAITYSSIADLESTVIGHGLSQSGATLMANIPLWLTNTAYLVGAVVRFTDEKIYRCDTAHTSGTFATDLAAVKWVEISAGMAPANNLSDVGSAATSRTNLAIAGKTAVYIPAAAMTAATTNGAASGTMETTTNKNMLSSLDFDATTSEIAQFSIVMPKSWNESTVTASFNWTAASGSGTVIWTLAGVAISNDDTLDVAFGTLQSATDTLLAANDNHLTDETSAITIAGTPAALDYVNFKITRDISDTLGVDARLLGCTLFLTLNETNDA